MITDYNKNVVKILEHVQAWQVPAESILVLRDNEPVSNQELGTSSDLDFVPLGNYIEANKDLGLERLWTQIKSLNGLTNSQTFIITWMLSVNDDLAFEKNFPEIQRFLENTGRPINRYKTLVNKKNELREVIQQKVVIQTAKLQEYKELMARLNEQKNLPNSKLTVNNVTVLFVLFEETVKDLLGLFNSIDVDPEVPYVTFTAEDGESYFKVFKGDEDTAVNFKKTLELRDTVVDPDVVYLNLLIDGEYLVTTIEFNPREKTYVCSIKEIPVGEKEQDEQVEKVINILCKHISYTQISYPSELYTDSMSVSVDIYMANLIDYIFVDFVINDDLFSSFLKVKENKLNYATLRSPIYVYTPVISEKFLRGEEPKSLEFTMEEQTLYANSVFNYIKGNEVETVTSKKDSTLLHLTVTNVETLKSVEKFIDIFKHLVYNYTKQGFEMCTEYRTYVPELKETSLQPKLKISAYSSERGENPDSIPRITEVVNGKRQLMSLKKIADSLIQESKISRLKRFVPSVLKSIVCFARHCQVDAQPLIIHKDDVEYWQKETGYEVTRFGKDQYNYVAIKNSDIKDEIPKRLYSRYLSNLVIAEFSSIDNQGIVQFPCKKKEQNKDKIKVSQNTHVFISNKVMGPGRCGLLNSSDIELYLKQNLTNANIKRLGVAEITPNSFLHCVASVFDAEYEKLTSFAQKENYVVNLRKNFFDATNVLPELLSQELYNLSLDQIKARFTDTQTYFDPLKYYRALEEHYQCSIYVFSNDSSRKEFIETLEIPNHDFIHVRPKPKQRVLMVIAHGGAERDRLSIPQCELVINETTDSSFDKEKYQKSFPPSFNNVLYPVYQYISRNITWNYQYNGLFPSEARINLFSAFDYEELFEGYPITGQFINNAGKARAFALNPQWKDEQHTELSDLVVYVCVNETQPLNVAKLETAKQFPEYRYPVQLFGKPTGYTAVRGQVSHLWFQLADNRYGYHCPVKTVSVDTLKELFSLEENDEVSNSVVYEIELEKSVPEPTQIERYNQFVKVAKIIEQIYKYLFLVQNSYKRTEVSKFIKQVSTVPGPAYKKEFSDREGVLDSYKIYNIDRFTNVLPDGASVKEILEKLHLMSPSMFPGNKILVYNSQMLKGLQWRLSEFSKEIEGLDLEAQIPEFRILKQFYLNEQDFTYDRANTQLFLDKVTFEFWKNNLDTTDLAKRPYTVEKFITEQQFGKQTEPFIYQMTSEVICQADNIADDEALHNLYIVQNAKPSNDSFLYAMEIARVWYYESRNTGFKSEKYRGQTLAHVIYRINNNKRLEISMDNSNGQTAFLELLEYSKNNYAALLPIL